MAVSRFYRRDANWTDFTTGQNSPLCAYEKEPDRLAHCLPWIFTRDRARAATTTTAATDKNTPGKEMAQTLSMITGVAISPLMGVGAVGAWNGGSQHAGKKAKLHWFANPLFWVRAVAGRRVLCEGFRRIALPPMLKKPFDVAETVNTKSAASWPPARSCRSPPRSFTPAVRAMARRGAPPVCGD